MINLKKYMFALSVASLSLLAVSCTDSVDYTQADKVKGQQVYFSNTIPEQISLDLKETQYIMKLMRGKTEGALTLELDVDVDGKLSNGNTITFPASVEFADGASSADIVVNYSVDERDYDKFLDVTISLMEGTETTPYGNSTATFKIGVAAPWGPVEGATEKTMATFVDGVMPDVFGAPILTYKVEIQQNASKKHLFRLVNPYGKEYPLHQDVVTVAGSYDYSKDYYLTFTVEDPNSVVIDGETGYTVTGYGTLGVVTMKDGVGKYEDGIVTFPPSGLAYTFNGEPWNFVNKSGELKIAMPGIVLTDYDIDLAFGGLHKANDGSVAGVMASINSIGDDVTSIGFAVEKGDYVLGETEADTTALLKSIGKNIYSTKDVEYPMDYVVPFVPEESGVYSLLAVALEGEGVGQVTKVLFSADAESWTPAFTANYSSQFFRGNEEKLVINESTAIPNKYKITGSKLYREFVFESVPTTSGLALQPVSIIAADPSVVITSGYGAVIGGNYVFILNFQQGSEAVENQQEVFTVTGTVGSPKEETVTFSAKAVAPKKEAMVNRTLDIISEDIIIPFK